MCACVRGNDACEESDNETVSCSMGENGARLSDGRGERWGGRR